MRKISIIVLSVLAGALLHCGSGGDSSPVDPGPVESVSEIIAEAWQLFESAPPDYSGAAAKFSNAITADDEADEAWTGRGWCYAFLGVGPDDTKYTQAISDFNKARVIDSQKPDTWAGLAFVQFVLNDYNSALSSTNQVLSLAPDYVFSHKTDINVTDIYLMRAHIYFFQAKYDEVVAILDILEPGVTHPVDQPDVLLGQLMDLWGN